MESEQLQLFLQSFFLAIMKALVKIVLKKVISGMIYFYRHYGSSLCAQLTRGASIDYYL